MLYGSASSLRKDSFAACFSISMEVAGSSAAPKWVIRKMRHWPGTTVWRLQPGCFQRARKNSVLNGCLSGENQQALIWHS